MNQYLIEEKLLQVIINILQRRPYQEVHPVMDVLRNLNPIEKEKPQCLTPKEERQSQGK